MTPDNSSATKAVEKKFWGSVRELFVDVRVIMVLIVGLFAAGVTAAAQLNDHVDKRATAAVHEEAISVRATADAAMARATRAVEVASETKADFKEFKADIKAELRGVREDLRLGAKGKPLPPLPPPDDADAGQ